MMFWSGETIKNNRDIVSEFCDEQVDCNSYRLRMGDAYYVTSDKSDNLNSKKILSERGTFSIPPGQLSFLLSKEKVHIPSYVMGFISMRTGFKFKGLINVSGFNVDPGYNGRLLFAVYNAGSLPVNITEGESIFKIWFALLDNPLTFEIFNKKSVYDIESSIIDGASREILSLQSLSDRIDEAEKNIQKTIAEQKPVYDDLRFVYRALILGVVIAAAGAFIKSAPLSPLWSKPSQVAAPSNTSSSNP